MLFKSQAGTDKSSSIVIDISTIAKRLNAKMTPIFIDFKSNPIMVGVDSSGTICGMNADCTEPVVWNNAEDLALQLRNMNPTEVDINGTKMTVEGICSVEYDKPTKSLFVKTNGLGIAQRENPNLIVENYISYMMIYRQLKKNLTTSRRKLNKPNNYSVKEHELYMMGYMPLAILSQSLFGDITQVIQEAVELTPLIEGKIVTEGAYGVDGRALDEYETIWVTKRSVDKFMQYVRPGYYNVVGYEGINLFNTLVTLLEYAGYIDGKDYSEREGFTLPPFAPVQRVPFTLGMTTIDDYNRSEELAKKYNNPNLVLPYELEIKRMYPVIDGISQDPKELLRNYLQGVQ